MSTKKIRKPGKNAIPGYTLIPKGEYYQVRKIGIEPGRVNTDPVFANTRKQNADFATMSRITGLLRKTLENGTGIKTSIALLSKALWKMLKADYRSRYGQRTPLYGPQEWLEGVNCNTGSTLKEVLGGDILVKVSERGDHFYLSFPGGALVNPDKIPIQALQYKICVVQASFQLGEEMFGVANNWSNTYPVDQISGEGEMEITMQVNRKDYHWHIAAVGIQWLTKTEGKEGYVPVKGPCPIAIVKAWTTIDQDHFP